MKRSITKNYIYNLIYNVINVLIPFIIAPYLSRVLGVDCIGIKSYTLSIVSTFIIFANLGVAEYGQKEIAQSQDDKYERTEKFYSISIMRFITTTIVTIIYIIFFVLPIINKENNIIYAILLINILANALDFSWFLQGIEKFKFISLIQIFTKLLLMITTFIFVKNSQDIWIAILINSIVLLLNSIIPIFAIKNECIKIELKDIKPLIHIKPCLVYFIPAIAIQIYTVLDKTMIGAITKSNSENGYYEQADKIIKILIAVITSANIVMRSRISYLYKKKEEKEIDRLINKSLHLTFFLSFPIVFGIISISSILVPIYFGNGYEKTIIILNVLAPLTIIIGISNLLGSHYFTPTDRKRESNIGLIIGSVVNLILNSVLIKNLGALGAAIASVIAESVVTYIYVKKNKILKWQQIFYTSKNYLIASLLMFLIVLLLKNNMQYNIMSIVILGLIGVIVYFIVLILLKDKFLKDVLKKIKGKIKEKIKVNER